MRVKKRLIRLDKHHSWGAPPGYQLVVLERGSVHICIPRTWIIKQNELALSFHDVEPPNENCRIQLSRYKIPPGFVEDLPFESIVRQIFAERAENTYYEIKPIVFAHLPHMKRGWIERKYMDREENRPIQSRTLLALENDVKVLITFDCWLDDVEKFQDAWEKVLETLKLGHYVKDLATGETFTPEVNEPSAQ